MNLKNIDEVKAIQSDLRAVFESESGKKVMQFLEVACGWYESIFTPVNRDLILVNAGKREVVATIKTLLEQKPEQIVALAEQKEQ